MRIKTVLRIALCLVALVGAASAETYEYDGVITLCTGTCASFVSLDVGATVRASFEIDTAPSGLWGDADIADVSLETDNPAAPASGPGNPTTDNPLAVSSGSGEIASNGSFGTTDATQELASGTILLEYLVPPFNTNGAYVVLDVATGIAKLCLFYEVAGCIPGATEAVIAEGEVSLVSEKSVYLQPVSQTITLGDQVSVELWWDFSAEPTLGGGVDIAYDASRLGFVSYTASGDGALDSGFNRAPDASPGLLAGIAAGNFAGVGGPVKIGTVVFDTLDTGVTNVTPSENVVPAGPFVSAATFSPYGPGEVGFTGAGITIDPPLPICGDSAPGAGEECDDGNTTSGDGCSATCTVEDGFECTPAVAGNPPTPSICTPIAICGNGIVEPGEECDGGACCSVDFCTYLPAGTECRAAAGECDLADLCDGVSAACSADLKDSTSVCRPGSGDPNGSGFVCDPDEICNGVDNDCPPDVVEDPGTVCNAGSGDPNGSGFVCDPEEVCSGTPGQACPADLVEDQGTVCNAGSGDPNGSGFVCDPDEVCSGVADEACPKDTIEPVDTVCNEGSGDPNGSGFVCDPDEVCSGVAGDACPADTYEPSNTVCNPGSGDPTASGFVCDPEEYCPGAADAACPIDTFEPSTTVCRADAGECDVADFCAGIADEGCPEDLKDPCALVTDSSLCQFDVDDAACGNGDDQFRLLFTPDVKNWVAYKHNATNPGQYYYNLVTEDIGGVVEITVAYPFVTQGAQPIHVYCAEDVPQDADACFLPEEAEASYAFAIAIEDYIASTFDPNRLMLDCQPPTGITGPDGEGSCSFQVDLGALDLSGCSTGQAYINVHLDWGLKGPMVDANPSDDGLVDRYDRGTPDGAYFDALVNTTTDDGPGAISNCRSFEFRHTEDGGYLADAVQNVNVFKPIAGAMGTVSSSLTGDGVPGVSVALVKNDSGDVVKTGTTDEDGFYTLAYKHRGRKAPYTVFLLGGYDLQQGIELKANGWGEINFDVHTGTSTAEFGTGAGEGGSGEGGVCDNDGVCEVGEDCASCVNDCDGQAKGKPADRFCCGNGVPEPAEGAGDICDGNF